MAQRLVTLNSGLQIPQIGFGTFQIWNQDEAEKAVTTAIDLGYRLIDTAAGYFNEEGVGRAIRNSGVPREQIILTTKLWPTDASYDGAKRAVARSLHKLGTDYIDVYLLHQAFGDYYGAWRALRELQQAGVIRAIGVSNFNEERLDDLATFSGVVPAINQIQRHPYKQQAITSGTARRLGTVVEAWSPLAQGNSGLFADSTLGAIAEAHHATIAQVALAWQMQQDVIVIPKSVHKQRMAENLAASALQLSAAEMVQISQFDRNPADLGTSNTPDLLHRLLQIDPDGDGHQ
jgi:diketogulonate reductase-like aldo/keto reductase